MSKFKAEVVLDSVNSAGERLVSVVATYPRFIHSEVLTHRDRARNSASSRAIPWNKMRSMIMSEPVVPIVWGMEQKGMQTGGALEGSAAVSAEMIWTKARNFAVGCADELAALGVHKSLCNRLTEPFMWMTCLMTSTEWKNFFRLRCHPDAEVHFQQIARLIRDAVTGSTPTPIDDNGWHLPFISAEDWALFPTDEPFEVARRVSAARCARLSYLTHDGKRDIAADLGLFARLIDRNDDVIHASPLEHVACAMPGVRSGPFKGWGQYRKHFINENVEG